MTLTELDALPATAFPVQELADHLRLGTGFTDDGSQDTVLEMYLRAAMSAIEGRTGKALLQRRFGWEIFAWKDASGQALPIAPVSSIESVTTVSADGVEVVADANRFALQGDTQRPTVVPRGAGLPTIPDGGSCTIVFVAGFSADWSGVPAGLAQAVRLLAATYFEHRSDARREDVLPLGVAALIEPYRPMRLGRGAL